MFRYTFLFFALTTFSLALGAGDSWAEKPVSQAQSGDVPPESDANPGPTNRAFYLRNETEQKVFVAATFYVDGKWQTQGYWDVLPDETVGPLFQSQSRMVYIFAVSEDRKALWSGSDVHRKLGGQTLGFKRVDINSGTGTHILALQ